jgi:hypothetical protein
MAISNTAQATIPNERLGDNRLIVLLMVGSSLTSGAQRYPLTVFDRGQRKSSEL